jgi:hypothetical protein
MALETALTVVPGANARRGNRPGTARQIHLKPTDDTTDRRQEQNVTTTDEFSLSALIRNVVDSTAFVGPDEVAAEVARLIPNDYKDAVLTTCLRSHVHTALTQIRSGNGRLAPLPTRSAKGDAIRVWGIEQRDRRLTEQLHVGPGEWKLLVDCTAENLRFVAAERMDMARRCESAASTYTALADALDELDVKTVRDLPDATIEDALGGAE